MFCGKYELNVKAIT